MTGRDNLRYTARAEPHPRAPSPRTGSSGCSATSGSPTTPIGPSVAYSRGMRQRLGLADALVKDPSILILDEPTVNIDPEGVRDILLLVERLRTEQGVTVLLSSHLLHQVEQVCDRIGMFVSGRLAAMGTIDQLASELTDRWRFAVGVTGLDDAPRRAARRSPGSWRSSAGKDGGCWPPTGTSVPSCRRRWWHTVGC